MNKKKLKYTYILRISIAIRCNVSTKTFFSMITLNTHTHTYTHARTHTRTRAHIHIHTHTHTHTPTITYTYTPYRDSDEIHWLNTCVLFVHCYLNVFQRLRSGWKLVATFTCVSLYTRLCWIYCTVYGVYTSLHYVLPIY